MKRFFFVSISMPHVYDVIAIVEWEMVIFGKRHYLLIAFSRLFGFSFLENNRNMLFEINRMHCSCYLK